MLQVLLLFLYMGATCGILGYGALSFLTGLPLFRTGSGNYRIRHGVSPLLAGVLCAAVYAQIFSLFAPVGLAANLLLIILCFIIAWHYRGPLTDEVRACLGCCGQPGKLLLFVFLVLLMAYGTSHGIMHYDTGLYHAQSIRWIEEYGVVKGIANLHSRLGYNSAAFAFSALYSFAFTGNGSLHAGAGFFAMLLAFSCLDIRHIPGRGRPVLTDFVRLAGIYYLFNIYKEIVSPAPDYFLNCYLFCLLILWLDLDERRERHYLPYALIVAGISFAVTIKLSAALLLLLCVKPIAMILRERKREDKNDALYRIAFFSVLTFAVALPWMLRNLLVSGWVLYPSVFPDLLHVLWKVPHDLAEGDAAGIRAYARGGISADAPFREWFLPWFSSQTLVSRVLLAADLCTIVGILICLPVSLARRVRTGRKMITGENGDINVRQTSVPDLHHASSMWDRGFLVLEGTLLISFLFWFLQSPLIRYGFFFVWTPPVLFAGQLVLVLTQRQSEQGKLRFSRVLMVFLAVFLLYKGVRLIQTDITLMHPENLLVQQDYERFELIPYEVDGETFYYAAEGDRTGYDGFPGGDHRASFRLLGNSLRDGLRAER